MKTTIFLLLTMILGLSVYGQKTSNNPELINYYEFTPDTIPYKNIELPLKIYSTYQLDSLKIVTGSSQYLDGEITKPDTERNYGQRLLLLNSKNEILFKSKGVGDVYLFEPHFYKNNKTKKIVIVCQLAYEYYFGGEAFIFENGKIEYIGLLDIEPDDMEKSITDVLKIDQTRDKLQFTFKTTSLLLEPGAKDKLIKNTGVSYIYENKKLKLVMLNK